MLFGVIVYAIVAAVTWVLLVINVNACGMDAAVTTLRMRNESFPVPAVGLVINATNVTSQTYPTYMTKTVGNKKYTVYDTVS